MLENKRQQTSTANYDSGAIAGMEFSPYAGANKVLEVGRCLQPIGNGNNGFTTDASTIRILPNMGRNIAVFNNTTSMGAVTLSTNSAQSALAAGVADANGNVGIPCIPGQWTYLAAGVANYVVATSANLLVFLIADDTYLRGI